MSSRPALAELLPALTAAMAERRWRWYLFGAQAAVLWGRPRLSADADITARIELAEVDVFIRAMTRHGFDPVFSDADFIQQTRVIPFIHRSTQMPLDVVLAGPGLEEDFLRRAVSVDVEGTLIPVISPEDLIITKVLAGRPKDIEDVRNVIQEQKQSLDVERIRSILGILEQAFTRGDLLPVFEQQWSKS